MSNIPEILEARQKAHGNFEDHAEITQDLKQVIHNPAFWHGLSKVQMESLEMIIHKIGRILAGNPNIQDHWDDISGYAALASKDIETNSHERGL
jgi:hypothetical protein